jgi:hypothetical protein
MGALDDHLIPIDETSRNDLRIRIRGGQLYNFMKWYNSRVGRETETWREFHEELIASGILDSATFPWAMTRHIRRVEPPIRYSDYAQSCEILVADIYELIPNPEQDDALRELRTSGSHDVFWASEQDIARRGYSPGVGPLARISATASWTV